jgi:uncharacterized protein
VVTGLASRYPYADAAAADAILGQTQRWLETAVIGLNLCPFAKAVHVKQQIRYAITAASSPEQVVEELVQELALLDQADPESISTTLLVHPQVLTDFLDFNDFLDTADATIESLGLVGVVQVASFHPQYQFADSAADAIENYTNRSPYPTLHLLREESLDRAVEAFPDPESIFGENIRTLQRLGHAGWHALFDGTPNEAPQE